MIAALLIFLFPLAYSPGPGNMAFAATGAQVGLRGALPALTGYHLATLGVTAAVGLGLEHAGAVLPMLLPTLRWFGIAYILWLALRLARAPFAAPGRGTAVLSARMGALLLVLNPKAWLIILTMFTQFPENPLRTTVIFTLNNLVAFLFWGLAGQVLGRLFSNPRAARILNLILAAMLAGSALWIL